MGAGDGTGIDKIKKITITGLNLEGSHSPIKQIVDKLNEIIDKVNK